ncbi:MAG: type II toxin-antitoxin system prevent-host-death family antitoxin [Candidatus Dormiibacterota bacterium]
MERRVSVRRLNQQTSAVLAEVSRGRAVTITSGGTPVARLVPLPATSPSLDRLVAAGRAVAPSSSGPLKPAPSAGDPQLDVAALLAADRASERW